MTWELKTARDLTARSTYVREGDYHALARVVKTLPALAPDDEITFTSAARWASPGEPEVSTVLDANAPLYILTCTCNGMAFIANRWTFTGECSCVHHPLPKEN